jgi:hypothetical protein
MVQIFDCNQIHKFKLYYSGSKKMASLETSVFISVLLALILIFLDILILPTIAVNILFIIVFSGFIASAMAGSERNSYRVGGIAGGVLSVIFFLISFFTAPTLSYNLYALGMDFTMISQGLLYLVLGFVFSLAVFMFLGALGGLIAQELFGPKDSDSGNQRNSKTV